MATRPYGPRDIARSPSPSPYILHETPPLTIRKPIRDAPPPPTLPTAQASRPTTPSLSLQIPAPGTAPRTPRPLLSRVQIPTANGNATATSDSPTYHVAFGGGYYGGPVPTPPVSGDGHDQQTIRPQNRPQITTMRPAFRPKDDLTSIRDRIEQIDLRTPPSVSEPAPASDELRRPTYTEERWSDEFLEEVARLGEGNGGAVHKVKDKRTGLVMARKTITTREAPTRQLLRELDFMSNTVHINICHFHGAYISPSSSEVKVLMEICEGGSLEAVGKRIKDGGGRVSEKVAGRLAEGMFQGLAYLHAKRIIHRDIKPSNILLSRLGVVKLCDFGVSGELGLNSNVDTFTGTSYYMAPERISGQSYSIRADVWSAGLSLLEFVQNRFPFPNDLGPIDLMMYITEGDPPELDDEFEGQWSDDMKVFIKTCLTLIPADRPYPRDVLGHTWIIEVMKKEVNMARWIREVWGWPRPRRPREGSSRPPSSQRDTANASEVSPDDSSPPQTDS